MSELLRALTNQSSPIATEQAEVVIAARNLTAQSTSNQILLVSSEEAQLPLLARWAVRGIAPIASPNDLRNPDTSTWNKSTEDADT